MIFLYGIWRHIKEFGIEGQIPRIPSTVKPERRDPKQHVNQNITYSFSLMKSYHTAKLKLDSSKQELMSMKASEVIVTFSLSVVDYEQSLFFP